MDELAAITYDLGNKVLKPMQSKKRLARDVIS